VDNQLVTVVALILVLSLVVIAGILLVVFRRQLGTAIGIVQSFLFGSFGRRASRTNSPMLIVVGIGTVLLVLVFVALLVLAMIYPHTFHFHG
jgi:hypothetical protein